MRSNLISTSDFSKGTRYLHKETPFVIVDITVQSPTARGGSTLIKVKARNLLSGQLINDNFKAGTKFEQPDITFSQVQYLFQDAEDLVFMDLSSYEQFQLTKASLENEAKYLTEELKIKAMYFNGTPISIEIPSQIELIVTMVEPGTKGNTASSSVTTKSELSNGMECQVPLNIKEGDKILVDTVTNSYYSRS
ncbi:MAG: elongation factor P [Zetaproteobacteria bacterium]|nr:elongation factor P [Pseudobdellovibrionaceae bacterium]|tara:strand:+ start:947 stop:1525 length:579 start_codon:yes stop_codon:yes gene_type:complete